MRQAADKPPRSAAQDAGLVNCRFPPAADPLAGASLQCAGAIRLGPVAAVRFAGPDRYWDGCHDFGKLSAREARRTQPARIGPRRDELGTFATLISRFVHLPVSADNPVSLCDQGIFMDQAAKPVPAQNAHTGHFDRRMRASGGRLLLH